MKRVPQLVFRKAHFPGQIFQRRSGADVDAHTESRLRNAQPQDARSALQPGRSFGISPRFHATRVKTRLQTEI